MCNNSRKHFRGPGYRTPWLGGAAIIVAAFLVLLSACDRGPSGPATPPPSPPGWQWDWLAGGPCAPPCWEGITPGVTTCAEAEALLLQDPRVSGMERFDDTFDPSFRGLSWDWRGRSSGGGVDCYEGIVRLTYFGCARGCDFTFGDVLAAYGEPSHVYVRLEEPFDPPGPKTVYVLEIYYIGKGFYLDLGGQSGAPPELNRDLRFTAVRFFVPTMEGFLDSTGNASGWRGLLFPWQGFKTFDEYLCLADPDKYPNLCGTESSP